MDPLSLLAAAIAPGVAISFLVYWKDKFDREPGKLLFISFILGMISIYPAIVLEGLGSGIVPATGTNLDTFIYTFIVVGGSEEFCKFLMLRIYAYRKKEFNEPFDGITYGVMVAMGFATLENILYVMSYGMGNAVLRMFTAVPAHATFGIIMGYYVGLAKFRRNSIMLMLQGLLLAIIMHGAYDFFLMAKNIPLIAAGAMLSLILGVYYSLKAIRLHQHNSPFRSF